MKVVLFCGGLGTRIREYSESDSQADDPDRPSADPLARDAVLQPVRAQGFRAVPRLQGQHRSRSSSSTTEPQTYADCVVSELGGKVELLGEPIEDWRVTLIDTGIWRNIGERLWAVRDHVEGEEMFLANYSDGLTDVNLDDMIERFKASGKIACFLAVRPPLTYHLADIDR